MPSVRTLLLRGLVLAIAWAAVGCGGSPVAAPRTEGPLWSASPFTPTTVRTPTATPPPTATPVPTRPPSPSPLPTVAPSPTVTPSPTATPSPHPTRPPTPSPVPTVALTPLGAVSERSGEEVTVEAAVIWVSSFPKGFRFLLEDETGRATLLLWANVYDRCAARGVLMEGAVVRARGTVARYKDEWQIEPRSCRDVEVLAPGYLPPERAIGSIGPADRTTRATLQGTVVAVEPLAAGLRLLLDDGSGRIAVVLWNNLLERIPQAPQLLQTGARIRVSGVIDQYRNQMELIPQLPVHVAVVE